MTSIEDSPTSPTTRTDDNTTQEQQPQEQQQHRRASRRSSDDNPLPFRTPLPRKISTQRVVGEEEDIIMLTNASKLANGGSSSEQQQDDGDDLLPTGGDGGTSNDSVDNNHHHRNNTAGGSSTNTTAALTNSADDNQSATSTQNNTTPQVTTSTTTTTTPLLFDEDTPAGEAVRATAGIHVRKSAKLARKIHVQQLRKFVKKATLRGNKRGKPPRIPPNSNNNDDGVQPDDKELYQVDEGDGEDDEEEDGYYHHNNSAAYSNANPSSSTSPQQQQYHDHDDASSSSSSDDDDNDVSRGKHTLGLRDDDNRVPAEVLTATMRTGKEILAVSDPHDILSNQRWRKRRRRGTEIDVRKSYVKGKVIDGQHELYALSIAVMLGVRTSIGTTNIQMKAEAHQKRWLSSDDFMAVEKYQFKPSGSSTTPPHQLGHTFKFKDYSPLAFAYIRRLFGINEFDFLLSVCGNANFIEFISNAKSGQFFFYSNDGKFMIKTMTNSESKFLRRILPHYFRHCTQNPNTLMTKFLGMYRVKLYHLRRNVKFVIMNSVYYTDKYLQQFYDLKGSVTGRDSKPHHDVKKDNDLRRLLPDGALALDPVTRIRLRKQVVADCEFMRKMKIMDYSMLVGIHHVPGEKSKNKANNNNKNDDSDVGTTGFRFYNRRDSLRLRDYLRTSMRSQNTADGGQSLPGARSPDTDRRLDMLGSHFSTSMPMMGGNYDDAASSATESSGIQRPTMNRAHQLENTVDNMTESERQFAQLAVYDYALDDDDDNSYLEGSLHNPIKPPASNADNTLEAKKQQTIQQVYWPFQRLFDINGHRRLVPGPVDRERDAVDLVDHNVTVVDYVAPISDRKDGGLMMDTTGFELPLKFRTKTGREHPCEGKIFYMGVIDILQQYNMRKRVEARYRRIQGSGWRDASCVHPDVYAERFVQFFDEYTQRLGTYDLTLEEGEEGIVFESSKKQEEESKEEE